MILYRVKRCARNRECILRDRAFSNDTYLSEEQSYICIITASSWRHSRPIIWLLTTFQSSIRRSTRLVKWKTHVRAPLLFRASVIFHTPRQKCMARLQFDEPREREKEKETGQISLTRYFSQPRNPRWYACLEMLTPLIQQLILFFNVRCIVANRVAAIWIATRNSYNKLWFEIDPKRVSLNPTFNYVILIKCYFLSSMNKLI